ncbi:hypothetical protein ABXS75_12330 [Roseburia hominis]
MKNFKKIISLTLIILLLNLTIIPPTTPPENGSNTIGTADVGGGFDGSDK